MGRSFASEVDLDRRAAEACVVNGALSLPSDEIPRRRSFAIVSPPDAGKTTLTEKLLLFGGAIQLAGEVKASGGGCARIGWRSCACGTPVSSAVMSFEHEGLAFNLLDTPGQVERDRLIRVLMSVCHPPQASCRAGSRA